MTEEKPKVYIVFQGTPARFSDLSIAEEFAADMCEKKQKDYTITVVDRELLDHALVARYMGVRLMTIKEATEGNE